MTQLGGHAVHLATSDVGLGTRESVADVARNLDRWVDGIMVRTFGHAIAEEIAAAAAIPVINALTDLEHPCQALADVFTLRERFGASTASSSRSSATATTCSTRSRSSAPGSGSRFGWPIRPVTVRTRRIVELARSVAGGSGRVILGDDPLAAVRGADIIYTDAWTSMGQEAEAARRRTEFAGYQVDDRLLAAAGPATLVMHCLPAHRGEEISSDILDGPRSWSSTRPRTGSTSRRGS